MRVVFAGTPAVAVASLDALAASAHDVVAVLTRPDAPAGRGRRCARSPVGAWADAREVPVLSPRRPRDPDFLAALRDLAPDCCPVVAYGALVPREALDIPVHGWVNLHFSLLPAWRGAAPVQRALMAGDELTGATTFRLAEGLDTGPVYGVLTERVRPRDTAGELLDRLAAAGAGLLVATLDGIEAGRLVAAPQGPDGVSLAPKVGVDEARVDWTLPAHVVDRRVRGCTPEPGAWTTLRGERVKLGPVCPTTAHTAGEHAAGRAAPPAGELVAGRREVLVGTGTTAVTLTTVQPPGKRPMPAEDWARGLRLLAGEAFA
jgi:methionyl-tRNA formyltransferase